MEFVQFHPTGMVWPPGVRGLLVTEAVRGEGGILRNKDGERFMWNYLPGGPPRRVRGDRRGGRDVGHRPVQGPRRRRPTAAGAVHPRQRRAGDLHGGPRGPRIAHGGVFLDISYLPPDHVRRKLPSMYDQFKELADVDITKGPMEVGPTTHYVMGGDPGGRRDRRHARCPGCSRPARSRAACTAQTGSAATRCRTCSSSGRGRARARRDTRRRAASSRTSTPCRSAKGRVSSRRRWSGAAARTRTRSSATSRRSWTRASASSGSRQTCSRRSRSSARLTGRWPASRRRAVERSTPAGTCVRAPEPAHRLRGDRPPRPPANREPRRPQPPGLPGDRRGRLGRPNGVVRRRRRTARWR